MIDNLIKKGKYSILIFAFSLSISDSVFSQSTYLLNYSTNGTTVNTCSGTFYDSGGAAGNYGNNEDYVITFCTSSGNASQKIQLAFTSFALEGGGADFMEIYDGSSVISPLIGYYSSNSPGTITASGNCLTVHFVSNYGTTMGGWAATVSCTNTVVTNSTCSGFSILAVNYNNNTLTKYDGLTGTYLSTVATNTEGLAAPNFMYQLPNGVLLVPNGSGNNVIKLNPYTGASLGVFASGLSFPEQIKLGLDGNLYLANQGANNLKKYDYNGNLLATISNANFSSPQGIGFDANGDMLVSNNVSGGRINKYTTAGTFISTLYTYPSGEIPRGIAMLGNDLYINVKTSGGARVDKFTNATGAPTTFLTMDAGSAPYAGIVWGPDGRLYIADYGESEAQIYNSDGSVYRTITTNLSGSHGIAFAGCTVLSASELVASTFCNASTGSITVNATGGIQPYTYLWSTGATTPSVSGLSFGTYYVTVSDWNHVSTIDTVVMDCVCPTITNPSGAQSVCAGVTGTNITVNTNSNGTNGIRFVRSTTDLMAGSNPTAAEAAAIYAATSMGSAVTPTGASNPYTATYTYNPVDFPNAGTFAITYYVYAIMNPDVGANCRPAQEIVLTIYPNPTITSPPTAFSECLNGTQSLSVTATGGLAPLSYQWQKSTTLAGTYTNIVGAIANIYTPPSTAVGTLYYRVVITSANSLFCNPVTSSAVGVTIVSPPSVLVSIPPTIVCVGANVTLTATPTIGTGTCTVQWQSSPDGTTWSNISGATGNTYNTTSLGISMRYRAQLLSCTGNGCCN